MRGRGRRRRFSTRRSRFWRRSRGPRGIRRSLGPRRLRGERRGRGRRRRRRRWQEVSPGWSARRERGSAHGESTGLRVATVEEGLPGSPEGRPSGESGLLLLLLLHGHLVLVRLLLLLDLPLHVDPVLRLLLDQAERIPAKARGARDAKLKKKVKS